MNQLTGVVRKIVPNKQFGFIRSGKEDYFFHKDDFDGFWSDLENDFLSEQTINVEFLPTTGLKGLRAQNVRRTDYPNQAV